MSWGEKKSFMMMTRVVVSLISSSTAKYSYSTNLRPAMVRNQHKA